MKTVSCKAASKVCCCSHVLLLAWDAHILRLLRFLVNVLWFIAAASSLGRWHYGTEVDGSHFQAGEGKGKGTCTESCLAEITISGCSSVNVEQGQCSVTVSSFVYTDIEIMELLKRNDFVVLLTCIKQEASVVSSLSIKNYICTVGAKYSCH